MKRVARAALALGMLTSLFALLCLPGTAQTTITPQIGGSLNMTITPVNIGSGDHFDPHVDGNLACYTSDINIRYYDFTTGVDAQVPAGPDVYQDLLCDVQGGRIVYSRVLFDRTTIMLFDTVTGNETEIDPQAGASRFSARIGGNTVAYIDSNLGAGGELVVHDLATNSSMQLTNDAAFDVSPNVSPDGNTVTWQHCAVSYTLCDIWQAVKSNGAWTVSVTSADPANEEMPDTNGNTVVYDSDRPSGAGDLFFRPVAGGTESQIQLSGTQINAHIAGNYITFESRDGGPGEIYLYDIAQNQLYNLSNSLPVNDELDDVTVLSNGQIRVIWDNDEAGGDARHVYSALITPHCIPRQYTLYAGMTYNPLNYVDALVRPNPPLEFALPSVLPVVSGNAGAGYGWSVLVFRLGAQLPVACAYLGANAGKEYDFVGCTQSGLKGGSLVTGDTIYLRVVSARPPLLSNNGTSHGGAFVQVYLDDATCNW